MHIDFHSGITILMVEDDEGHATLIQKNLRRAGISNIITHFSSGKAVLDHFFGPQNAAANNVEQMLMLLDLNLPEVDGYEVLKRMKGDARTRSIPIIILTTTDNPREIDRCYELGCNVYVTKPVDYENFAEAIRKLGLMLAVVKVPHNE
jgi:CheY-like chemotaxis protein